MNWVNPPWACFNLHLKNKFWLVHYLMFLFRLLWRYSLDKAFELCCIGTGTVPVPGIDMVEVRNFCKNIYHRFIQ